MTFFIALNVTDSTITDLKMSLSLWNPSNGALSVSLINIAAIGYELG